MNKTKRPKFISYYVLMFILGFSIIGEIILFSTKTISLIAFLISLAISAIMFTVTIISFIVNKKKIILKVNLLGEKIIITDRDIIDLYNRAGIPVIYDEEGKIKNIFELLGLKVLYDENGNRIATIYEQLGIVPRFKKDGKEVPTFLVIKNRVNGLIKPAKGTGSLKRLLTDAQKEELLLRKMLEQKLEESEKNGDVKKAKVIKKVIQQKKKESESSSKKSGYTKTAKPVKPSSLPKVGDSKYKLVVKGLFSPSVTKLPQKKTTTSSVKGKTETVKNNSSGFSLVMDENSSIESNEKKAVEQTIKPSVTLKPIQNLNVSLQSNKSVEKSNKTIEISPITINSVKNKKTETIINPQTDDKLFFSIMPEDIGLGTGLLEGAKNHKQPEHEKNKKQLLGGLGGQDFSPLNKNLENLSNER